jgi:hypothetical protein
MTSAAQKPSAVSLGKIMILKNPKNGRTRSQKQVFVGNVDANETRRLPGLKPFQLKRREGSDLKALEALELNSTHAPEYLYLPQELAIDMDPGVYNCALVRK